VSWHALRLVIGIAVPLVGLGIFAQVHAQEMIGGGFFLLAILVLLVIHQSGT